MLFIALSLHFTRQRLQLSQRRQNYNHALPPPPWKSIENKASHQKKTWEKAEEEKYLSNRISQ